MADCRDLEPMLAPYVDGDADQKARATVDAHLRQCPPCRDRVTGEQAAREVLDGQRGRERERRGGEQQGRECRQAPGHAILPA